MTKTIPHTQIKAADFLMSMATMIDRLGVTKYDWNSLMFEYGMQYLYSIMSPEYARELATIKEHGYWASWLERWANDDGELLQQLDGPYTWEMYKQHKLALLDEKI